MFLIFNTIGMTTLALGASAIALLCGIILAWRLKRQTGRTDRTDQDSIDFSALVSRTKYSEVNGFRYKDTFLLIGLVLALSAVLMAFQWTRYDRVVDVTQYLDDLDTEIEINTPRTPPPAPPPPPPPPPKFEPVPDDEIEPDEAPDFVDVDINADSPVVAPPVAPAPPPPPPPPPPPSVPEEGEILVNIAEEMPRFPGCEDMAASKQEKKQCADKKLLEYVYTHIRYPAIARENGVEGTAVVSFVVEKDGSVSAIKVLRDPGAGLGDEGARVIELFEKDGIVWTPGKQRGRPVRVQFNLPIKFKLE